MSRLARFAFVPALLTASIANAQSAGFPPGQTPAGAAYGQPAAISAVQYDTARIVAVAPVYNGYAGAQPRNCRSDDNRGTPVYGGDGYYGNGGYRNDGYYGNTGDYGNRDGYGNSDYGQQGGSGMGRTMAGVVGSVVGAVLGSQVGGGSGRYIGAAVGSAVGGAAGAGVYDNAQRQRQQQQRRGYVSVCDLQPDNAYYPNNGSTQWYDVTYVYAGRSYTRRLPYRPQGDTLRVRVDVQPQ